MLTFSIKQNEDMAVFTYNTELSYEIIKTWIEFTAVSSL